MFSRISVCPDSDCGERLWHAGLSPDGRYCFLADCNEDFIVWDVQQARVVWREDESSPEDALHPELADWVDQDGYITIAEGPASGKYQIFGLQINHARCDDKTADLALRVEKKQKAVVVVQRSSGRVLQVLEYEWFSGDWAFASFSYDGSVLAVIEPYFATFFREGPE